MGSFWHGKEMIGVSVWYTDRNCIGQKSESKIGSSSKKNFGNSKKKVLKSFDEYYV